MSILIDLLTYSWIVDLTTKPADDLYYKDQIPSGIANKCNFKGAKWMEIILVDMPKGSVLAINYPTHV